MGGGSARAARSEICRICTARSNPVVHPGELALQKDVPALYKHHRDGRAARSEPGQSSGPRLSGENAAQRLRKAPDVPLEIVQMFPPAEPGVERAEPGLPLHQLDNTNPFSRLSTGAAGSSASAHWVCLLLDTITYEVGDADCDHPKQVPTTKRSFFPKYQCFNLVIHAIP